MRFVRSHRNTLRFGATLLLAGALAPTAAAQDPTKIEIVANIAHAGAVASVTFSPDGARALSASFDRTLKLWDTAGAHLLRTFEGHTGPIYSAAYSPDGVQVVSASGDKTLKVWVAATGKLLQTLVGHTGFVYSVAYSPDGTRILSSGSDKSLKLWDSATGQLLRTFQGHSGPVYSVKYSPDGTGILSGSEDKTLKLWDMATGLTLRTFEGHSGAVYSVAFSPDGARAISGSHDKTLKLWDAATGQALRSFEGHSGAVYSVAYAADGARVLSGSLDKSLKLWDLATGQSLRSFEQHTSGVRSVAFSSDNQRIVSGSVGFAIRLWEIEGSSRLFETRSAQVLSVAFSPDRTRLLSGGSGGTLDVWNATTGNRLHALRGHAGVINSVAFSADGKRLISGSSDKTIRLWDAATGNALLTLTGHSSAVRAVAFSPDGARVGSGSVDKTVKLWNAATGQLLHTLQGHSEPVHSVAFSPDGMRMLSGGDDKSLKLWDTTSGQLLRTLEGHASGVTSVAFSPDGARLLSGSWDRTLKLWNAVTGELVHTLRGHTGAVEAVAFSPDGARLLSGSYDSTLGLWDAATGRHLRTFDEHSLRVSSVAFSADGDRLLSGSWDRTIRIWNQSTDKALATLFSSSGSGWLTMTPAGFYTASERSPALLSIVRGLDTTSVAQVADHLYRPDIVEQLLKGDPLLKYEEAAKELHLYKILGSGSPPQIETLPVRPEDRTGDIVRLRARIVDTGGGIGDKVVWRVNGVTQGSLAAPAASRSVTDYRVAEQAFNIDPSKRNIVDLVAYNKAGLLASVPHLPFVVDRYATTEPRPSMHILAIGVSEYADKDWRLQFAVSDAKKFVAAVRETAEPIYHRVSSQMLLDGQVTKQAIDAAFRSLKSRVAANDVFVLFVAGHGRNAASTYYFLPQDITFKDGRQNLKTHGIGQDLWQTWLAMIPAQKSVLVFDTCESAGAVVLSRGASERQVAMDRLQFATGRSVIAAARNAAIEGYNGHGVLTYAILDALAKTEGSSEHVYVMDVATHVDRKVPEFSQQLTGEPQYPHNKIEGNFPIGVRKAVLVQPITEIPVAPTHLLGRDELIREAPGANSPATRKIEQGEWVRVVEWVGDGQWAKVALAGQLIGYLPHNALIRPRQ